MLPFVSSDEVNLVALYRARQGWCGRGIHHPTSQVLGHRPRIIFVEVEFMGNLTVTQIQPHQIQPGDPDPQRLVVPQTPSRSGHQTSTDIPDSDIAVWDAAARLNPVS